MNIKKKQIAKLVVLGLAAVLVIGQTLAAVGKGQITILDVIWAWPFYMTTPISIMVLIPLGLFYLALCRKNKD